MREHALRIYRRDPYNPNSSPNPDPNPNPKPNPNPNPNPNPDPNPKLWIYRRDLQDLTEELRGRGAP